MSPANPFHIYSIKGVLHIARYAFGENSETIGTNPSTLCSPYTRGYPYGYRPAAWGPMPRAFRACSHCERMWANHVGSTPEATDATLRAYQPETVPEPAPPAATPQNAEQTPRRPQVQMMEGLKDVLSRPLYSRRLAWASAGSNAGLELMALADAEQATLSAQVATLRLEVIDIRTAAADARRRLTAERNGTRDERNAMRAELTKTKNQRDQARDLAATLEQALTDATEPKPRKWTILDHARNEYGNLAYDGNCSACVKLGRDSRG